MDDTIEYHAAAERFQPEDVDPASHDPARCNLGAGVCPACSTAEND